MKNIINLLVWLFVVPFWVQAEVINTVYIDNIAPIIVDGDLSDWDSLNLKPIELKQFNMKYSKPEKYKGELDISAFFTCFSDEEYIYVSVIVTDDHFVFGEAPGNRPYWDDCVEVFLYGDTVDSPIQIWITASKDGVTKLEGKNPFNRRYVPYLWEKKGVKAELKPTGVGYVVELAVPHILIEQVCWDISEPIGINIGVYDNDEGLFDTILEWTTILGDDINKVTFNDTITLPIVSTEHVKYEKEIELVVNAPAEAEYSKDPAVLLGVAKAFEKAGLYSDAYELLEKIVQQNDNVVIRNDANVVLARIYYYQEQYKLAQQICNVIVAEDNNLRNILSAKMVLMSIQRKM